MYNIDRILYQRNLDMDDNIKKYTILTSVADKLLKILEKLIQKKIN